MRNFVLERQNTSKVSQFSSSNSIQIQNLLQTVNCLLNGYSFDSNRFLEAHNLFFALSYICVPNSSKVQDLIIFSDPNFFSTKNFFQGSKFFGSPNFFEPKKFVYPKIFWDTKNVLDPKILLGPNIFLEPKPFLDPNISLVQKSFWI